MPGPVNIPELLVRLADGIFIENNQTDGGPGGSTFEGPGENFHPIRLFAGAGRRQVPAGVPAIQVGLDMLGA